MFGTPRYFLPVANVINIKQAGPFLDERYFYVFNGYQTTDKRPELSAADPRPAARRRGQLRRATALVGDTRRKRGFRHGSGVPGRSVSWASRPKLNDLWSIGLRGIYRKLHNAIDDMQHHRQWPLRHSLRTRVSSWPTRARSSLSGVTPTATASKMALSPSTRRRKAGSSAIPLPGAIVGQRGWDNPTRDIRGARIRGRPRLGQPVERTTLPTPSPRAGVMRKVR